MGLQNVLLTNLFLITPLKSEISLRFVLCKEIPYKLIKVFAPFFRHFRTNKYLPSWIYWYFQDPKTGENHKNMFWYFGFLLEFESFRSIKRSWCNKFSQSSLWKIFLACTVVSRKCHMVYWVFIETHKIKSFLTLMQSMVTRRHTVPGNFESKSSWGKIHWQRISILLIFSFLSNVVFLLELFSPKQGHLLNLFQWTQLLLQHPGFELLSDFDLLLSLSQPQDHETFLLPLLIFLTNIRRDGIKVRHVLKYQSIVASVPKAK